MSKSDDAYAKALDRIKAASPDAATELDLEIEHLTTLPEEIATLTNLSTLFLSSTQVTDLTPLTALTHLSTLSLYTTQVTDLTPLSALTNLSTLDLDNTQVTDLTPLSALTNLSTLSLSNTQVIDLAPLTSLTNLSALLLWNTKVTDLSPLSALTSLTELDINGCPVTTLAALTPLTNLHQLELRRTRVADLRPLTLLRRLADDPDRYGLTYQDSLACRLDPRLAELSEIDDNALRARETFAYLDSLGPDYDTFLKRRMQAEGIDPTPYFPPAPDPQPDTPSLQDIEKAITGPVLSDSLVDLAEADGQLQAVPLLRGTSKPRDADYDTLTQMLAFAARRLADTQTQNRLSEQLTSAFAAYAPEVEKPEPNARILHFLAQSVRGAMANEHDRAALDGFDTGGITEFLRNHDDLLNGYFAESLRPAAHTSIADPADLAANAPQNLRAIRAALAMDDIGLLAPNVSDTQEMLARREEGIRRGYLTGDEAERAEAGKELGKVAVYQTAFLGVLLGRLRKFSDWGKRELKIGRDDPMGAAGRWGGASAGLEQAVRYADKLYEALYPTFVQMWQMITNLNLPF